MEDRRRKGKRRTEKERGSGGVKVRSKGKRAQRERATHKERVGAGRRGKKEVG